MSDRAPCVRCGAVLHNGDGRVLVAFTADELARLACDSSSLAVADRAMCALGLLDAERERQVRGESAADGYLRIFVPGLPETKGSWRSVTNHKTGKPHLIPDNPREEAWALAVAWNVKAKLRGKAKPDPTARFAVTLEFTLPAPKGKKNTRDLDKMMRSILDALTGLVWSDDEHVVAAKLEKRIGDTPGALIVVERVNP